MIYALSDLHLAILTTRDKFRFMNLNMIAEQKINIDPLDAQTRVFKILALRARFAILNILRDGEHCVCHFEAYLSFRNSYISQQLAVLCEADLIQDRC